MLKSNIINKINLIMGNSYANEYEQLNSINTYDKLVKFQNEKLEKLITHSYNKVPYYRQLIGNIKDKEYTNNYQISDIPILNKNLIRKNHNNIISKDIQSRKWYYNSSGGSTGEPIRFIQDNVFNNWRNATNYYYYKNILGIVEPVTKKVLLWGSERDIFKVNQGLKPIITKWLTNTIFLNSFRMTEEDMDRYIKIINTHKPQLIRGYAGSLYEICNHAEKRHISINSPMYVISAAETLRDEVREKIESTFGAKVYNFYGSREVSNLAGECKFGSMHIFSFWNYFEILNKDDMHVKENEEGKVVVTNLFNYSMPLIRYEIGDMAILGSQKCKCGSILPTIKKITGRITDHFVKKDGTIIHGEYFTHLFYLKDWVKNFQIIQTDYVNINILIVKNGIVNKYDKKDIEEKIKLVMGIDCNIKWNFVDEIYTTNSGKYIYTKSLVGR